MNEPSELFGADHYQFLSGIKEERIRDVLPEEGSNYGVSLNYSQSLDCSEDVEDKDMDTLLELELLKSNLTREIDASPRKCTAECGEYSNYSNDNSTHNWQWNPKVEVSRLAPTINVTDKPYECGICGERFTLASKLDQHIMTNNISKVDEIFNNNIIVHVIEIAYYCKRCKKWHINCKSNSGNGLVDKCGIEKLDDVEKTNVEGYGGSYATGQWQPKVFVEKLKHCANISDKPYGCVTCGKRFVSRGQWKWHTQSSLLCQMRQTEERYLQCGSVRRLRNEVRNVGIHSSKLAIQCTACNKWHIVTKSDQQLGLRKCDGCVWNRSEVTFKRAVSSFESHHMSRLMNRAYQVQNLTDIVVKDVDNGPLPTLDYSTTLQIAEASRKCETDSSRSINITSVVEANTWQLQPKVSVRRLSSVCNAVTKPYQCGLCNKRFTLKDQLKRHVCTDHWAHARSNTDISRLMIIHSLEVAFHCTKCSKWFVVKKSRRKNFLQHQCRPTPDVLKESIDQIINCRSTKERRDQKNYCSICERNFSRPFILREHSKIHSGDLYHCDLCNDKFVYKANLVLHKKTKHIMSNNDNGLYKTIKT